MNQGRSGNGQGIERMPPQAVEVEQAVLGAMLLDARAIGRAIELLDESCFYHEPHSTIYQAVVSLYDRGEAVDSLTLAEELRRRGKLDDVGGVVYLATLSAQVATAANIDYHARIVFEKALSRRLIDTAAEVSQAAYEGRQDVQELLDWAEQRIFALSEQRLGGGFESLEAVMSEALEQIERAHNRASAVTGVDTGFPDLNDRTAGLQAGDLVILAARPSVGKSALAIAMARHAAVETNLGVAIFSLEMSKIQVAQRLLSAQTHVDLHKLRTGRLRDEDWVHLTRSVGRLAQAPVFIDDTPGITVLEARAKARRLKREHGIGLVVIDYLQLMSSHERVDSREQEISRISRGLKALAKELGLPVLALSQLSRAVESRTDRRPQLSDLRESGCLAGNTLVTLADTGARVPIGDLVGQSGFRIWALNEETLRLEPALVSRAFATGRKPVYRLTTRLGRRIRATANHKFRAFAGWRRLDELKAGDRIALPRRLGSPDLDTLSSAHMALLGHLIGDGCTLPRHAVQYTTREPDLAQTVVALARQAFGDSVRPRICPERAWYQVYLAAARPLTHAVRNPVARWLGSLGAFGGAEERLSALASSDVYWDEILSIEPDGEEEVFDLTVPAAANFVADDVIVHNSIEQDADVVMFIYRPELYGLKGPDGGSLEGIAEIIIGKQRNGPTGSVHLMWNAHSATYEQLAPEWRIEEEGEGGG
ncbi:MAG: replicative DNA helicase [Candidatus Latescibacterota bacterium]